MIVVTNIVDNDYLAAWKVKITSGKVVLHCQLADLIEWSFIHPSVQAFSLSSLDVHFNHCNVPSRMAIGMDQSAKAGGASGIYSSFVKLEIEVSALQIHRGVISMNLTS